jgi:hypothetical protein
MEASLTIHSTQDALTTRMPFATRRRVISAD